MQGSFASLMKGAAADFRRATAASGEAPRYVPTRTTMFDGDVEDESMLDVDATAGMAPPFEGKNRHSGRASDGRGNGARGKNGKNSGKRRDKRRNSSSSDSDGHGKNSKKSGKGGKNEKRDKRRNSSSSSSSDSDRDSSGAQAPQGVFDPAPGYDVDEKGMFSMRSEKDYAMLVHGCVNMLDFSQIWGSRKYHALCMSQDMFCDVLKTIIERLMTGEVDGVVTKILADKDVIELTPLIKLTAIVSQRLNDHWELVMNFTVSPFVRAGENRVMERLFASDMFKDVSYIKNSVERGYVEERMIYYLRRDLGWRRQFASTVGTFLCLDTLKKEGRSSIKEHNRAETDFNNAFYRLVCMIMTNGENEKIPKFVKNHKKNWKCVDYSLTGFQKDLPKKTYAEKDSDDTDDGRGV